VQPAEHKYRTFPRSGRCYLPGTGPYPSKTTPPSDVVTAALTFEVSMFTKQLAHSCSCTPDPGILFDIKVESIIEYL